MAKIFSGYEEVKPKDASEDMATLQKNKSGVKLKDVSSGMRRARRSQLENAEEGAKFQSDVCSMISEDIGRFRAECVNKEESKGKKSSSEEIIKWIPKDSKYRKINFMQSARVDEEYFYQFGTEIPDEIANLLGKVVGKAIFEGIPIVPRFNRFILKCMISQDFELDDLGTYDQGVMNSIKFMANNDFNPADLYLTFGFIDEKKYGDDQLVTNYNKHMFLEVQKFEK